MQCMVNIDDSPLYEKDTRRFAKPARGVSFKGSHWPLLAITSSGLQANCPVKVVTKVHPLTMVERL